MSHVLHQLTPHVVWLSPDSTTDRPILGAVSGARGTLVVDTGNGPAHASVLVRALAEQNLPAPGWAMLTHWHWDHVFGTAVLDLPTFAHTETQRIVRIMAHLDWRDAALDGRVAADQEIAFCRDMIKAELPDRSALVLRPPDIAFTTEVRLDLGDVACHLLHVGGDHAPDSSVVYVPEDKVVFLGDCIYDDIYHGPRRLTMAHLEPLLERVLGLDAAYYVLAHHDMPLSRTEFADEVAVLTSIGRVVEQCGLDRAATLATLPTVLGTRIDDEHVAIADAFIAGLQRPNVDSVW